MHVMSLNIYTINRIILCTIRRTNAFVPYGTEPSGMTVGMAVIPREEEVRLRQRQMSSEQPLWLAAALPLALPP